MRVFIHKFYDQQLTLENAIKMIKVQKEMLLCFDQGLLTCIKKASYKTGFFFNLKCLHSLSQLLSHKYQLELAL